MAISVDTVYQRVLALANKEQRGYITPQEYNLLANQAQMSIFESYFYAKNQRDRAEPLRTNEVDETDISELLNSKLAPFESNEMVIGGHTFPSTVSVDGTAHDVFHTGLLYLADEVCQKVEPSEAQRFKRSTRHMATTANQSPIYADNRITGRDVLVYAGSTTASSAPITVQCFRVPKTVNWPYVVVNKKALYNSSLAVDFELHKSESDTLVNKILELSGIVLNKIGLTKTAGSIITQEQQTQNT
tara:strand:- start:13059 stop:13793 length:735 start_codon:yes stop_codon:yes gene_type:complete